MRQLQKLQECLKSYENQGRYEEDDVNLFYSQGFGDHTPPPPSLNVEILQFSV